MREKKFSELLTVMFRKKRYRISDTSIEQDVTWLNSEADRVFSFHRLESETPQQLADRQNAYKKRAIKKLSFLFFGGLKESVLESQRIYIDNSNASEYEIRKMKDGRIVLVSMPNFNGDNPLAESVIMPKVQLPYTSLHFLVDPVLGENDTHFVIECDVVKKYINVMTPEVWSYFIGRRIFKYYEIHIQKGVYPPEMPSLLGYVSRMPEMELQPESEALGADAVAEQSVEEQSGTGQSEYAASVCKSFKYKKPGIALKDVITMALVAMGISVVVALIMLLVMDKDLSEAVIAVVLAFVFMVIFTVITRQDGMMKKLTQYFRDEQGQYYMVQFTKGASETGGAKQNYVQEDLQKAQSTEAALYYVNRFKAGYKDWDAMVGGEAKVIHLKNLQLLHKGGRKSKYTYENGGRKKMVKILNAYEGLAEEF